jgi:hypothetical protein
VVLFERGVRLAGFASTPVDLASVRRLREIAATDGAEALAERQHLVTELLARLPTFSIFEGKEDLPLIPHLNR